MTNGGGGNLRCDIVNVCSQIPCDHVPTNGLGLLLQDETLYPSCRKEAMYALITEVLTSKYPNTRVHLVHQIFESGDIQKRVCLFHRQPSVHRVVSHLTRARVGGTCWTEVVLVTSLREKREEKSNDR